MTEQKSMAKLTGLEYLQSDWKFLADKYGLDCDQSNIQSIGNGHINDTFHVIENNQQWILQRINHAVFTEPFKLQNNFDRVAQHLSTQNLSFESQIIRKTLDQQSMVQINGRYWRLIKEIRNCHVLEIVPDENTAFQAAIGFGSFDKALLDLPTDQIAPIIPGFFDLSLRLRQLKQAIGNNNSNKVARCAAELLIVEEFRTLSQWIPRAQLDGNITQRVVHCDTKISNILLCNDTQRAKAVIDWDTIMPGYWLLDFGDMIRSFTASAKEDTNDNLESEIRWNILQAATDGFLSVCAKNLSPFERDNLLVGAEIMFFMLGVRFLTDYLNDDIYFKTQYEEQNLLRCRNQFSLLKQLARDRAYWAKNQKRLVRLT